ncbi:molybdenum cofactor guanylyltransferase [Methanocella sp. CWC-04]|uniref:Probable molybdenum cofactor guanylyltransferase n=1 Tax=Methanooceanicella nereidis TaxID=2052831 RepID=A0AAP2RGB7_9EURY|nr:molybdenum cofactor guanylyltransferase [Methanocella sp. CWC-04]MCD1296271.1 molybdenum cofactor guanylyltransferase [Methanocella sp. CWC-04]
MRSGIILAGGRSTRFGGEEKSIKVVKGKTMISRVMEALSCVVDEILVSVRDEPQQRLVEPFLEKGQRFVYDKIHGIGPMSGVNTALNEVKGEYVVIVACDMPFLNKSVIDLLFKEAEGHDAAVPVRENGFLEPLHAVYRRDSMIEAVRVSIEKGERRIASPINYLKDVVYVQEKKILEIDPDLRTFLNINRAEDMSVIMDEDQ